MGIKLHRVQALRRAFLGEKQMLDLPYSRVIVFEYSMRTLLVAKRIEVTFAHH
jgi:hypothetical protein